MNLILLFVVTVVLQVVVISAKFHRTSALRNECTSTFGISSSRSHHNTDGDCKRGWQHLNITNGSIQHNPSVKGCRYYTQKSLSKCKGSSGAQGCVHRHTWRAYITSACFDSWISLELSFRPNNNSSPCFRFHLTTKHITTEMTSRCPTTNNTTATWSEWTPIATDCDVTCKRQWRRQCLIGSEVVRVAICGDGEEREWRSCDDCKITRSRRDSNISDIIAVMPRSGYHVPPVQEQNDFDHESVDTPQFRYFSYWPGFATGFACCIVLVVMATVGLKIVKCLRERRKNRRKNELRLYYAKPNQAWQMKLAHPAQTSVKSRTQGHVDAKVAGARYAEDGDVSTTTNHDLYPTAVCHHDSGYQADDETNEKARIVPTTSPKPQTPHELLTSAPQKVMMPKCRDVMASYDSCYSAEGNAQQQHGSSNRSSPFLSFLKIHGDDGDDGELPLVPYSYRLRLTAKQRAPATQACYRPDDLLNDKSTTAEVKKYGTDMSST